MTPYNPESNVVHPKRTFMRVQVLRFIAAAAVVLYHAQLTAANYFANVETHKILAIGAYGVDLFFVISGFIIFFVGSTRETDPAVFVRRRIERIVPMYWLITAVVFMLGYIPGLVRAGVSHPVELIKSLLFLSWTSGPAVYPVLNVGWTLEYEMFFYAIAALAMMMSKRPWLITALAMLALVLVGRGTSFFIGNPIILEFVLGMAIGAFVYDRRLFRWILGGVILVLCTLPPTDATWRVWACGIPAAAIVSAAIYADMRWKFRGTLLPELGNASYSIYLVHVVAISFACKILSVLAPNLSTIVIVPLLTVFAIVTGYCVYRFLEKNLLALLSGRHGRTKVTNEVVA